MPASGRHPLVDKFAAYSRTEGRLAPKTTRDYEWDIENFRTYIAPKDLRDVDKDSVVLYIGALMERGLKPSTLARKLFALRAFYQFLVRKRDVQSDPTDGVAIPAHEREARTILTRAEVQRVLNAPTGNLALRDKAMIALYFNGLKRAEVSALKFSDLDLEHGKCKVAGRLVPLNVGTLEALRAYLKVRPPTKQPALFVSTRDGRVTERQAWVIVRNAALRAGVEKNVAPEALRQAFAVHAIEDGHSLVELARIMGLDSMNTLQEYAALASKHGEASDLFGITGISDEIFDGLDMRQPKRAWRKITERLENDPAGAITSARTLLEAVCEKILLSVGEDVQKGDNPSAKCKRALSAILPDNAANEEYFRTFSRIASGLVEHIALFRNVSGDPHATSDDRAIVRYEAQYAVALARSTAAFLVHCYELFLARSSNDTVLRNDTQRNELRFSFTKPEREALLSILQMASRSSVGEQRETFAGVLQRMEPKSRPRSGVTYISLTPAEKALLYDLIPEAPRGSAHFVRAMKRVREKMADISRYANLESTLGATGDIEREAAQL